MFRPFYVILCHSMPFYSVDIPTSNTNTYAQSYSCDMIYRCHSDSFSSRHEDCGVLFRSSSQSISPYHSHSKTGGVDIHRRVVTGSTCWMLRCQRHADHQLLIITQFHHHHWTRTYFTAPLSEQKTMTRDDSGYCHGRSFCRNCLGGWSSCCLGVLCMRRKGLLRSGHVEVSAFSVILKYIVVRLFNTLGFLFCSILLNYFILLLYIPPRQSLCCSLLSSVLGWQFWPKRTLQTKKPENSWSFSLFSRSGICLCDLVCMSF